jgi:hypothetical protein
MFKNNRAQYILDGTVCRGLGGPVYCGKEFNFPADLPAQFARILHWKERKQICLKKIYSNLSELKDEAKNNKVCTSLAVFKPSQIIDFTAKPVNRNWSKDKLAKLTQLNLLV